MGTGSAIAHTAINSVFGNRHPDPVQVQQARFFTVRLLHLQEINVGFIYVQYRTNSY